MAIQTILDQAKISENPKSSTTENDFGYFLKAGVFFKDPHNRQLKFNNLWTFKEIDKLLRSQATLYNPMLEKASFEEILLFFQQLAKEELTEVSVPAFLLEQLIRDAQKAGEKEEEIKQKIKDEAEREIRDIYRKNLEKKLSERLTRSPVSPEERQQISADISNQLQERLEDSDLLFLTKKLKNTPPESKEYRELEEEVEARFSQVWQETINQVAQKNHVSSEKAEYLESLSLPVLQIVDPIETKITINRQKDQLVERIRKDAPNAPAEEIADALVHHRTFSREKTVSITQEKEVREIESQAGLKLSDPQLTEISIVLKNIEKTVEEQNKSISRMLAPPLTAEKAGLVASELMKFFPENLSEFTSTLPTAAQIEQAVVASVWQTLGSEIRLQPQEAAGAIKTVLDLPPSEIIVIRNLPLLKTKTPANGNPLLITERNGKTILSLVKKQLYAGGINFNPESDRQLASLKLQLQALKAVRDGVTTKDIETTIQKLLKSGVPENSLQIKELREVQKTYNSLLQRAKISGFPEKQVKNWQRQVFTSPRLWLSRFNTVLEKTGMRIPLFQKIRTWFLNTSLGKPIKLALEKSAQKSFQTLWTAGREGVKKIAVPLVQKVLVALGIGAKTALVAATNVVGVALLVVPKLIGKVKDFIKGFFSSGARVFSSVLSGLTGASEIPEDSDSKWLKRLLIGIFLFLFIGVTMDKTVKNSAMINDRGAIDYNKQERALSCFVFVGNWTTTEKEMINRAITIISGYQSFHNIICFNNEINLLRSNIDDTCIVQSISQSASEIIFRNKCLGNDENTFYSLSHELGHVLAVRSNLYSEFFSQVCGAENYICSYPYAKSCAEDFPETVAIYLTNRHYPSRIFGSDCGGRTISLSGEYPIHYNFIKNKL